MRLILVVGLALTSVCAAQEHLAPAVPEKAELDIKPEMPGVRTRNSSIRKLNSRSYSGTRADAARSFLADSGIDVRSLQVAGTRTIGRSSYVRLQQHIDDVPVRGAEAVVHVNQANSVRAIQTKLRPNLQVSGEWIWTSTDAEKKATAGMSPVGGVRSERLYVLKKNHAIPVWRVLFRTGNPAGDWEILVSATNGSIVGKQDLRMGAHALGLAYPFNPVRGNLEKVSLGDIGETLTSDQTRVFTYLPALRREVEPGTVVQGARRQDGHFLFGPDDGRLSEVQLFYGMESAKERFRSLGFSGFRVPLPGVVLYQDFDSEAQRFVGADNAFFSPSAFPDSGGLFFYLTSRQGDTSLDTDVIYHEYTHAVITELVGSHQSTVFRALNEGTADYFSSSFLDDPVLAEYAGRLFSLRNGFLRRTDNNNRWPYNVVGEEHADGNIWSGALWDVRQRLGAAVTDEIALNAIAMLSPDSEFFEAAVAAVTAAEELFGDNAAQTVAEIMDARGILTVGARTASRSLTLENGDTSEGSIAAAPGGRLLVGGQQYRIEVPNRATRLLVRVQADAPVRFYVRYRVPITIEGGEIMAEQVSPDGTDVAGFLSVDNRPELQAGTYYIAVVNTSGRPVNYVVEASAEGGSHDAPPAVTLLGNGESADGSVPPGPFLSSRQFAIEVPEGAMSLSVTLEGTTDIDLYVRPGRPVFVTGTGYPEADVVSNTASSREDVRITANNGGPLPAGVYFLGVYNYAGETAQFVLRARVE